MRCILCLALIAPLPGLLAGFGAMTLAGDSVRWSPMLHWTIQIIYGVAMFGVVTVAFLYVSKAERYAV